MWKVNPLRLAGWVLWSIQGIWSRRHCGIGLWNWDTWWLTSHFDRFQMLLPAPAGCRYALGHSCTLPSLRGSFTVCPAFIQWGPAAVSLYLFSIRLCICLIFFPPPFSSAVSCCHCDNSCLIFSRLVWWLWPLNPNMQQSFCPSSRQSWHEVCSLIHSLILLPCATALASQASWILVCPYATSQTILHGLKQPNLPSFSSPALLWDSFSICIYLALDLESPALNPGASSISLV